MSCSVKDTRDSGRTEGVDTLQHSNLYMSTTKKSVMKSDRETGVINSKYEEGRILYFALSSILCFVSVKEVTKTRYKN